MNTWTRRRLVIGIVAVVSVVGLGVLFSSRSGDITGAADLQPSQGSRTPPEFGEFATRHKQEPRDSPKSKSSYATTNAFVIDYKQALLDDVVMLAKHQKLKAIAKKFVEEVGIEEALKCLNDVAGPGENQSLLRLWLFQFAKEPEQQLLERARCLEFSEDKKWAMGGIVENILERGLDATSYKQHWLPLQEDETDAFMSLVKGMYKWRNPSRDGCSLADAVKMIKDAFPENSIYTKNFIAFLDNVSDYKSFETWDVCKAEILSDPLAFQNVRLRLLGSMVATDPERGLKVVLDQLQDSPSTIPPKMLGAYLTNFIKKDMNAASDWFQHNSGSLQPEASDAISPSFLWRGCSP